MTWAQQSLYRMCEAAGPEAVRAAVDTLERIPRRDRPFLATLSAMRIYLRNQR